MNNEKHSPVPYDEHKKETSKLGVEVGFPPYQVRFFVAHETETDIKRTPSPEPIEKQVTK